MRIHNGTVREEMQEWINPLYEMRHWRQKWQQLEIGGLMIQRRGPRRCEEFRSTAEEERWLASSSEKAPKFIGGSRNWVPSQL